MREASCAAFEFSSAISPERESVGSTEASESPPIARTMKPIRVSTSVKPRERRNFFNIVSFAQILYSADSIGITIGQGF